MQRSAPYHEQTDLPLIADGDDSAFHRLYDHYAGFLRPFLRHYTRSHTDLEDVIQETFIRVWLNRDRLSEIENLRAWIYRIACRVYLDNLERELKRRERKESYGEALYGKGLSVSEERTHLIEIDQKIGQALHALPEQKKKVYRLNRDLNWKPAQIAAHLNIPVGTVKNQLSAALREIREQLLQAGYGPVAILFMLSLLFSLI